VYFESLAEEQYQKTADNLNSLTVSLVKLFSFLHKLVIICKL